MNDEENATLAEDNNKIIIKSSNEIDYLSIGSDSGSDIEMFGKKYKVTFMQKRSWNTKVIYLYVLTLICLDNRARK